MIQFGHGETVLIAPHDPAAEDVHGNATDSWGAAVAVPRCGVYLGTSTEPFEAGRSAVHVEGIVLAPHGTAIGPHDRLTIRGKQYEVIGEPDDILHPMTGWRPGVEIHVRRVEG